MYVFFLHIDQWIVNFTKMLASAFYNNVSATRAQHHENEEIQVPQRNSRSFLLPAYILTIYVDVVLHKKLNTSAPAHFFEILSTLSYACIHISHTHTCTHTHTNMLSTLLKVACLVF